jgi:LysR family transcriptional regulator, hca operon transcriptional activator
MVDTEDRSLHNGFQTGHETNWLPRAMQVLRDELKGVRATNSSDYSPDLAEALVRGRIDVAFLRVESNLDLCHEVGTASR